MEELWDLYDCERRALGRLHRRGRQLKVGEEYHLVAFAWIFNREGKILLTLRSPSKKLYPNFWASTGGAVRAGETSRQAICREVLEETGIVAEPDEFTQMGTFFGQTSICDVYFLRKDIPLTALTMQPGETVAAKWVSLQEMDAMIDRGEIAPPDIDRVRQMHAAFEEYCSKK